MEELANLITLALARNKQLLQEGVKRLVLMSDKPIHYRRVYRSTKTIRKAREDAIETFAAHPIDVSEIRVNCMGRTYFDLHGNYIQCAEIRNFFGVVDLSGFDFKEITGVRKRTKDGVTTYIPVKRLHASVDKEDVAVGLIGDHYHFLLSKLNIDYIKFSTLLNHDAVSVELMKSMARLEKLKMELLTKKVFNHTQADTKKVMLARLDGRLRLYPYLGAATQMPDNLKSIRLRYVELLAQHGEDDILEDSWLTLTKEAKTARKEQYIWLKSLNKILDEELV